ncbi:MAG: polyprenyl synthetase family protein [Flexistipes sinusarabici]|uniref:Polyprenyl synthetase family protein n=1 Tax=Flexistipes sinusarabici TaxID=2352 RepID=A0A5D0MHM4_FLESI|nr:farnesyl diphosphate synthase [Flexistipes sinusarabici]TYB33214.1 MAG: polyprenyl synthetase family protein [Flexistipes sinusarabici]
MTTFNLKKYMQFWAQKTENWLKTNLSSFDKNTEGLTEAMRYSLLAGGKRLRPVLIYSSYGIFDNDFDKVVPYAAAVEMLHTYSLIHDDLPAMDDDDYRRGNPTNHKMFGEATAILAGDALLTKAFEVMLDPVINPETEEKLRCEAALKLAKAGGDRGMIAGQFVDVESENSYFTAEKLDFIHNYKTAALLGYCTELGAVLGYGGEEDKERLKRFGINIGLAFQIVDDLLDISATTEQLGKDAGSDLKKGKATYPGLYGVDESKKKARALIDESVALVDCYGAASRPLAEIARFVIDRNN